MLHWLQQAKNWKTSFQVRRAKEVSKRAKARTRCVGFESLENRQLLSGGSLTNMSGLGVPGYCLDFQVDIAQLLSQPTSAITSATKTIMTSHASTTTGLTASNRNVALTANVTAGNGTTGTWGDSSAVATAKAFSFARCGPTELFPAMMKQP